MSFWKNLFSAPEVVSKATDAVINTGDALVFTEEERSEANMRQLEWVLEFHKASTGSNLARRWIAVMTTAIFLLLVVMTAILTVLGWGNTEALMGLISETLVVPMGLIMGFYFTSGIVRDYRKSNGQ